jgi:hypothetical protein
MSFLLLLADTPMSQCSILILRYHKDTITIIDAVLTGDEYGEHI